MQLIRFHSHASYSPHYTAVNAEGCQLAPLSVGCTEGIFLLCIASTFHTSAVTHLHTIYFSHFPHMIKSP